MRKCWKIGTHSREKWENAKEILGNSAAKTGEIWQLIGWWVFLSFIPHFCYWLEKKKNNFWDFLLIFWVVVQNYRCKMSTFNTWRFPVLFGGFLAFAAVGFSYRYMRSNTFPEKSISHIFSEKNSSQTLKLIVRSCMMKIWRERNS